MNVFIDINDKLLAAIDYTIGRYGHESWFPAALKDATTKYLLIDNNKNNVEPLKIFKLNNYSYGYEGFHYIIDQIEKYSLAINKLYSYRYLCVYLLGMIIIILILLTSK